MPLTTLDAPSTLLGHAPIQLGTSNDPCTVLFGRNEIDAGKPWRTIKLIPNDADLAVLMAFDKEHDDEADVVKEHDDVAYVTVKVHDSLTKYYTDDKSASDVETSTTRDQRVKVVIRGRPWKMNGQRGVSLRAALVVVVDDGGVSIDDIM